MVLFPICRVLYDWCRFSFILSFLDQSVIAQFEYLPGIDGGVYAADPDEEVFLVPIMKA